MGATITNLLIFQRKIMLVTHNESWHKESSAKDMQMDMTYEEYIDYLNHFFIQRMLDDNYQQENHNA
jgi:hypothetical protein